MENCLRMSLLSFTQGELFEQQLGKRTFSTGLKGALSSRKRAITVNYQEIGKNCVV